MTLSPSDSARVRGAQGPSYKVGPRCSNPTCRKLAEHVHHIWRRSALGGPFDWVAVLDGERERMVGNLTGVCPDCHDDLTGRLGGHRARIEYAEGKFRWHKIGSHGAVYVGLLDPQPPTPETVSRDLGQSAESEACPFCGQHKRRRASATPGARRRKTWRVLVPDDGEDGAAILDALVEDVGLTLGIDPVQSGRYYILLPVLYHACQSKAALVESMKGVGG